MQDQRTFGSYLRAERELRQIPLSEVAAATKIPLRTLESLELGAWEGLPATVFVRGFVRAYARHLGLVAEEVCRRFDNTVATVGAAERAALEQTEVVGEAAGVGGRHRMGLALFVIIILIIATITLSLIWRRGASANAHAGLESPTLLDRA